MTTPNIEELRKLAEECLDRDPLEEGDVSFPGFSTSWCALQREFIMAANPSTVIALLDQLQSQAERIKELERESETHAKAYGLAIVERNKLRTEVEAVRKANLDCVDHYNAALDEINELGQQLKVAQEGWRCECSTDDACRFARERDAKAERIKELEGVCVPLSEYADLALENDTLRAQLDAIAATEPVLVVEKEPDYWSGGHFHEGSKSHIGSTKVWRLPIGTKLFTRPMPAQDVTELVEALERVLNCCDIAECSTVPNSPGALKNARTALANAKGAK